MMLTSATLKHSEHFRKFSFADHSVPCIALYNIRLERLFMDQKYMKWHYLPVKNM